MRCRTCHYPLDGLTEHRCPECGNAFDPNDPATIDFPAYTWEADPRGFTRVVLGFGALYAIGLAFETYFGVDPVIVALIAVGIGMIVFVVFWFEP